MKSITTVARSVANQHRAGQVQAAPETPKALSDEAARHVNDIFRALQGAFPAWRAAFPDDASLKSAKATWVKGLIEAGITDMEQIARGVRKARQSPSDFFPSVGRFIGWCKPSPEDAGLPPVSSAFREVCMYAGRVYEHEWSHPGVYEAGRRVGWFDLRMYEAPAQLEKSFRDVYGQVCEEILMGGTFEVPVPDASRLEHHASGREVMTEEAKVAGRGALSELKGLFR
jgi:hypothetical protein